MWLTEKWNHHQQEWTFRHVLDQLIECELMVDLKRPKSLDVIMVGEYICVSSSYDDVKKVPKKGKTPTVNLYDVAKVIKVEKRKGSIYARLEFVSGACRGQSGDYTFKLKQWDNTFWNLPKKTNAWRMTVKTRCKCLQICELCCPRDDTKRCSFK